LKLIQSYKMVIRIEISKNRLINSCLYFLSLKWEGKDLLDPSTTHRLANKRELLLSPRTWIRKGLLPEIGKALWRQRTLTSGRMTMIMLRVPKIANRRPNPTIFSLSTTQTAQRHKMLQKRVSILLNRSIIYPRNR
jgi:hypothetical protein